MTDPSKKRPSSSADSEPWHTTLAGAFGEAIGRGSDGKPDLGALVVPLLRSGAGAALIGNLLGVSSPRDAAPAIPTAAPDPHPLDGEQARHGGSSSPLATILPPVPPAASSAKVDTGPLLNALLGKTPPPR
jgi:hypothetical protein